MSDLRQVMIAAPLPQRSGLLENPPAFTACRTSWGYKNRSECGEIGSAGEVFESGLDILPVWKYI